MSVKEKVQDISQVERELNELSEALTLLNDTITAHAIRLQPVLYPEERTEGAPGTEKPLSSPLVESLNDRRCRLLRLIENLQDLTKRLEI